MSAPTPAPDRLERDPSRKAAEQVFDRLRAMIIALELEPGAVVNRADLQRRFALSSTPIRDALTQLSREGLVEIFPQSATRVSLIDEAKARQALLLRRALEQEAVRVLCESPDAELQGRLQGLVAQQRAAVRRGDAGAFDALDQAFHRVLYEAVGAPELFELVRQRSGHLERMRRLAPPGAGRLQRIVREHDAILRALCAADAAQAQMRVREHLAAVLPRRADLRGRFPAFFKPVVGT